MAPPKVGKVGMELIKDAQSILEDSGAAVRLRGCFDVAPALLRTDGKKLGLVKGFNSIFCTEIVKDLGLTLSDWPSVLSRAQLDYAAFDAFLVR